MSEVSEYFHLWDLLVILHKLLHLSVVGVRLTQAILGFKSKYSDFKTFQLGKALSFNSSLSQMADLGNYDGITCLVYPDSCTSK